MLYTLGFSALLILSQIMMFQAGRHAEKAKQFKTLGKIVDLIDPKNPQSLAQLDIIEVIVRSFE